MEQTKKNLEIIDREIENLWKLRFENQQKVVEDSKTLLIRSQEIAYNKGLYGSKLNITACRFLLSEHNEAIIGELYEMIGFFENIAACSSFVRVLNLTANVFHSYGDYKKALELCKRAQNIAASLDNETDMADNQSVFGLIYSDLYDYESAINHFKQALEIRSRCNDKKAIASSLNLIARTHTLSDNFSEALNYYQQVLNLRTEENDLGGLPWTHIGLASTYEKMNNYDLAIEHYELAIKYNEMFNDKRCKLHCFFGIGTIKSIVAPSKIAEEYLIEAQKIAAALNSKPMLYKVYKNLSELYERMMELPKAFAYYKLYHNNKEDVLNAKLQNMLKNQEVVFAIEKAQKEAEIYRLKHIELKNAYEKIEEKNREITDSLNYAKSIQMAMMPTVECLNPFNIQYFTIFKPRDIVSGDFYWINKTEHSIIVAVADCTGHGVPAALMSMLGISFLNEIVNINQLSQPDHILNELRKMIIHSLNKNNVEVNDGMDISLCSINIHSLEMQFAGAYNPLLVFRRKSEDEPFEMIQLNADRMPIGLYIKDVVPFGQQNFQLQKGDSIFLFSDGYYSQFGMKNGVERKLNSKLFKKMLLEIQTENFPQQALFLENHLKEWMGEVSQTDDITVLGIKF